MSREHNTRSRASQIANIILIALSLSLMALAIFHITIMDDATNTNSSAISLASVARDVIFAISTMIIGVFNLFFEQ